MAEQRELILKLGQKITDRIGHTVTVDDPEYWGLAGVVTDEMAEVALSMKVRVPATLEEIAKKCGKSVERTEELLKEMGIIRNMKNSTSCQCLYRAVQSSWL